MRRTLSVGIAVVALAFAAACSEDSDPAAPKADSTPTNAASEVSSSSEYAMPDGWPVSALPLPPGAATTQENVTDSVVFFHVDGVEAKAGMAFYDKELPALDLTRDNSSVINPISYESADLRVLVSTNEFDNITILVSRP